MSITQVFSQCETRSGRSYGRPSTPVGSTPTVQRQLLPQLAAQQSAAATPVSEAAATSSHPMAAVCAQCGDDELVRSLCGQCGCHVHGVDHVRLLPTGVYARSACSVSHMGAVWCRSCFFPVMQAAADSSAVQTPSQPAPDTPAQAPPLNRARDPRGAAATSAHAPQRPAAAAPPGTGPPAQPPAHARNGECKVCEYPCPLASRCSQCNFLVHDVRRPAISASFPPCSELINGLLVCFECTGNHAAVAASREAASRLDRPCSMPSCTEAVFVYCDDCHRWWCQPHGMGCCERAPQHHDQADPPVGPEPPAQQHGPTRGTANPQGLTPGPGAVPSPSPAGYGATPSPSAAGAGATPFAGASGSMPLVQPSPYGSALPGAAGVPPVTPHVGGSSALPAGFPFGTPPVSPAGSMFSPQAEEALLALARSSSSSNATNAAMLTALQSLAAQSNSQQSSEFSKDLFQSVARLPEAADVQVTSVFLHRCHNCTGSGANYRVCFRAVLSKGSSTLRDANAVMFPGEDNTPISQAYWYDWVRGAFSQLFNDWMGSIDASVGSIAGPTGPSLLGTWATQFCITVRAFMWIVSIMDQDGSSFLRHETYYTTKVLPLLGEQAMLQLSSCPTLAEIQTTTQKIATIARKHDPTGRFTTSPSTALVPYVHQVTAVEREPKRQRVASSASTAEGAITAAVTTSQPRASGACHSCGAVGHYSRSCPHSVCNACGLKGHWARDCPSKSQPAPPAAPVVHAGSCPVKGCTTSQPHEFFTCPVFLNRRNSPSFTQHCWCCAAANGEPHAANCPRLHTSRRQSASVAPAPVAPPAQISPAPTPSAPGPTIHPQRAALVATPSAPPRAASVQPPQASRPCPRCPGNVTHRLSECPNYAGCGKCGGKTHVTARCTRP